MNEFQLVIIAGDSGVYVGYLLGGVNRVSSDGKLVLRNARHLRRYRVSLESGPNDGTASDLAARGIVIGDSSVSAMVPGDSVLLGVRRVFPVNPAVASSFGVPEPTV